MELDFDLEKYEILRNFRNYAIEIIYLLLQRKTISKLKNLIC